MAPFAITRVHKIAQPGVDQQGQQVVIPREMLDMLNLRVGDFVPSRKQANGVLIKPKRVVVPEDVLTSEEAKCVRHGEAQMKRGGSRSWRDVKDELSG